jgi:hypothetical protein
MNLSIDIQTPLQESIDVLENFAAQTSPITTDDMKYIMTCKQQFDAVCDQILARYEESDEWTNTGFLSAQQAVVYETGTFSGNVKSSVEKGKLLNRYPAIKEAISNNSISYDHVVPLLPLIEEKYCEFFDTDAELLLEAAKLMPANRFARAITHWKYTVDEVIDDPSEEYARFEERFLHIYETEYGYWRIDGKVDPITGLLAKKALEDVRNKLWRAHDPETRESYTVEKQRADALGYLAQGYMNNLNKAETPVSSGKSGKCAGYKPVEPETLPQESFHFSTQPKLVADIVIDINDLNPKSTTRDFIHKCLTEVNPIISTHSLQYREQMLCDSLLEVPINRNGTYDLGHSVRTAPLKLKKQLMLSQSTCSIDGCITPAQWCDAHHIEHWAHGGETNLDNLALLCQRHHTMIHTNKTFAQNVVLKLKNRAKAKSPPLLTG